MKPGRFFVGVLVFLIVAANVFAQEHAAAPVFQEDDFWHFKSTEQSFGGISRSSPIDGVYELFYSQGKVRIFKLAGGQKEPVERAAIGPLLALLGQGIHPDLKFPLFVGAKWSYN